MKQMNQFEASINMLSTNIPIFVKNAFAAFMTVENELLACVNNSKINSMYSVDKILDSFYKDSMDYNMYNKCGSIKCDILSVFKGIMGINESSHVALTQYLTTATEIRDDLCNIEQPCPDSPDFYMPLKSIKGGFTNINAFARCSTSSHSPAVVIQPSDDTLVHNPKAINGYTTSVQNSLGYSTILDNYGAECIIDLFDLFKIFYTLANDSVGDIDYTDQSDSYNIQRFEAVHAHIIKPETMSNIVDKVSKDLLKTCIATYLTFAGKIRGSKSDLCGWLYTFFVKDSMRDVERGDYPDSSDIALQAGMQTLNDLQDTSKPDRKTSDMNNSSDTKNINSSRFKIRMYNGLDPSFDASVFYKNIRLLYSNWATVINVIIRMSNSYDNSKGLTVFDGESTGDIIFGRNKQQHSTVYSDHIAIARAILQTYLACRFRTYNTIYQLNMDKNAGSIPSDKLISSGINAIHDQYVKEIVKDSCKNEKNFFIQYDESIEAVFNSNRAEVGVLADKFMATAYLIMLDYLHTHQEEIISQDDPDTGKPKRELFEEIYYNLSYTINRFVSSKDKLDLSLLKPELVSATLNSSGEYSAVPFDKSYMGLAKVPFESDYTSSFKFSTQEIDKFKIDGYDTSSIARALVRSYFIVPPFSDSESITFRLIGVNTDKEVVNGTPHFKQYQTRATSLFPKNEVIIDELCKTRFNTSNVFNSIESVCDKLESSESEWAHSSYSDLAGITPTVINSEDAAEMAVKEMEPESPRTEEPILSKNDLHSVDIGGTTKVLRHDVDLHTNRIADANPSDSEDIKDLTTESVQIERYNKLFNKMVFGIK